MTLQVEEIFNICTNPTTNSRESAEASGHTFEYTITIAKEEYDTTKVDDKLITLSIKHNPRYERSIFFLLISYIVKEFLNIIDYSLMQKLV